MAKSKWTKQAEWYGNPELGLESWLKMFPNPLNNNRKTRVYVFGKGDDFHFVVSAGANSDFSYSGGFYPQRLNAEQGMAYVDNLATTGKLFR